MRPQSQTELHPMMRSCPRLRSLLNLATVTRVCLLPGVLQVCAWLILACWRCPAGACPTCHLPPCAGRACIAGMRACCGAGSITPLRPRRYRLGTPHVLMDSGSEGSPDGLHEYDSGVLDSLLPPAAVGASQYALPLPFWGGSWEGGKLASALQAASLARPCACWCCCKHSSCLRRGSLGSLGAIGVLLRLGLPCVAE